MYGYLGLQRVPVRAGLTWASERPTSQATAKTPWALGFGSAIGLAVTTMVFGAAALSASPHTVSVPLATVLGFGVITSALVAAGDRWRAVRRRLRVEAV